jgi:hypothetical protein
MYLCVCVCVSVCAHWWLSKRRLTLAACGGRVQTLPIRSPT